MSFELWPPAHLDQRSKTEVMAAEALQFLQQLFESEYKKHKRQVHSGIDSSFGDPKTYTSGEKST
jgi:hypothetical protein